jgi:hypothetical protein
MIWSETTECTLCTGGAVGAHDKISMRYQDTCPSKFNLGMARIVAY